jgi:hypothetical protein
MTSDGPPTSGVAPLAEAEVGLPFPSEESMREALVWLLDGSGNNGERWLGLG